MANYVVSDSSLGSVADAIRQKGGTSAPLEYPAEFISAIEAISTADEIIVTDVKDAQGVVTRTIDTGDNPVTRIVRGAPPLDLDAAKAGPMVSLTQQGLCTQSGTPTPDAPVDIVCNNGSLRYSANMANVNEQTARVGYYISAQGQVLADQYNWFYQAFIPCKPNTTYTLSMSSPVYYVTISEYSTADDSGFIIRKTGQTGGNTRLTITTGANTNFIRFGTNLNRVVVTLEMVLAIDWMLNEGGTAIPYAPYVEGGIYTDGTPEVLTVSADGGTAQTASVPMLLGVGNYKDEVELIHGIKTGKVGIVRLSPDWTWLKSSTYVGSFYTNGVAGAGKKANDPTALCTHGFQVNSLAEYSAAGVGAFYWYSVATINYKYDDGTATVEQFKKFLTDNAVLVLYPLATETTEQHTPQPLTVADGSQQLSVQAAVSGIQIEAVFPGAFPG